MEKCGICGVPNGNHTFTCQNAGKLKTETNINGFLEAYNAAKYSTLYDPNILHKLVESVTHLVDSAVYISDYEYIVDSDNIENLEKILKEIKLP